ncbi:MAG: histidine phosphatase family protein [Xanthomonadaceae bacterium]|nr:histidine phosphatase family protein [Xanthomonadaceae bacterium]
MRLVLSGWLLALTACAGVHADAATTPGSDEATTFLVVPNAEQAEGGSRNPSLSAMGVARAQALAQRLASRALTAVYAPDFRRGQQTAQPTAKLHGLAVTTYDPTLSPSDFAAQLRARHHRGSVLVVGQGTTVPGLVASLCACRIAALGEDNVDGLYTIRIGADGHAALQVGRQ